MIPNTNSQFSPGQTVRPNSELRGFWHRARIDEHGAYYMLVDSQGNYSNCHIPWDTQGVVTECFGRDLMLVAFPQGTAITRESWVTRT